LQKNQEAFQVSDKTDQILLLQFQIFGNAADYIENFLGPGRDGVKVEEKG
jgi:hypothetical protein